MSPRAHPQLYWQVHHQLQRQTHRFYHLIVHVWLLFKVKSLEHLQVQHQVHQQMDLLVNHQIHHLLSYIEPFCALTNKQVSATTFKWAINCNVKCIFFFTFLCNFNCSVKWRCTFKWNKMPPQVQNLCAISSEPLSATSNTLSHVSLFRSRNAPLGALPGMFSGAP